MRSGLRPTREGWVALVGGIALFGVGLLSGNNLLYLLAAPVWAVLLLATPLGWWNLRGLQVRRSLPVELYAGREASGRLLVRNPRRRLSAGAFVAIDEGAGAVASCDRLNAGQIVELPVRWRFGERGPARLTAVLLRSSWPFGLAEHTVRVPLAAELVVYPRPLPPGPAPLWRTGAGMEEEALGSGAGDFLGLRPYRAGDPPRTVHWPTTARLGSLVVVERSGETEVSVEITVQRAIGSGWERELSRATGEVHRALQLGRRVGLRVPPLDDCAELVLPPSAGAAWRRTLLETLALCPRFDP